MSTEEAEKQEWCPSVLPCPRFVQPIEETLVEECQGSCLNMLFCTLLGRKTDERFWAGELLIELLWLTRVDMILLARIHECGASNLLNTSFVCIFLHFAQIR